MVDVQTQIQAQRHTDRHTDTDRLSRYDRKKERNSKETNQTEVQVTYRDRSQAET